ncbi:MULTISPECIES: DNRLRE domain-containing protein [Myxococcaceae]|uniref:CBM96 family carbohydrate-binding protein n=1 Tax=Myxococcaceae TaxID=31 RepID=UPI00188DDDB7|nr:MULTISPECIES: DNRLRE domain-containing protein [Myxococcaceae]
MLWRAVGGVVAVGMLTHCGGPQDTGDAEPDVTPQAQELSASATFGATADARVEAGAPTTNFGTSSTLMADLSPQSESLLRFSVTNVSGRVTRATLRLYATDGSADGPRLFLTAGGWSESTVTWNTRPAPSGAALGDKGAVSSGSWMEYDVTSAVKGNGELNFLLVATSSDGTDVASRQAGTSSQRPQLVVVSETETGTVKGAWRMPDAAGWRAGMVSLDPASQDLFVTTSNGRSDSTTWLSRVSSSGAVRWSYALTPGPLTHPGPVDAEYQQCGMKATADLKGGAYLAIAPRYAPCTYRGRSFSDGSSWLAHVDGAGNVLALRRLDAPGHTEATALAVDPSGNLVVGGSFVGTTDLGAGPLTTPDTPETPGSAGYVVEYGPDLQLRWARKFDSVGGHDGVDALAVGPSGEVLLGTTVAGDATFAGQPIPGGMAGDRLVAILVNPDSTPRWMQVLSHGYCQSGHTSGLGTAVFVTVEDSQVFQVWILERDGTLRWTRYYSGDLRTSAIGADGALRLYFDRSENRDFGDGVMRGDGQHDHVVKLGLDGNVRWVRELPAAEFEWPRTTRSLAASDTGQSFVLATYTDPQRFGDVTVPSPAGTGVYLVRLAP